MALDDFHGVEGLLLLDFRLDLVDDGLEVGLVLFDRFGLAIVVPGPG
jgi:hypothetical protein